jgi:hypothetical protein
MKRTERQKAEQFAKDVGEVFTHVFRCDDGTLFEAIAISEKVARKVLRAERPEARATYFAYSDCWSALADAMQMF